MKILMVLTSHDQLGSTGKPTGFWLEEFASPYYVFKDAGATITLASPAGGQPPLDPKSDEPMNQTAATERFKQDTQAQHELANTVRVGDVNAADYDAVFYPGGHGPLWDLAVSKNSIALIEDFIAQQKPIALVCHAPAALVNVKQDGQYFVANKKITGFSNSEEALVGLTDVVPFLLETQLQELGGVYQKTGDFQAFVVEDGLLITGQNPQSSEITAKRLVEQLQAKKA